MPDYATDFAGEWIKITWDRTDMLDAIENGEEEVRKAVMGVLEYKAPQVEAHMKTNAPWQDQTGNARQGLRAEAFDLGDDSMGIILYHQVPYGIWLEIKNSGEYAIILPTIEVMGPEVMASIERILERIRF